MAKNTRSVFYDSGSTHAIKNLKEDDLRNTIFITDYKSVRGIKKLIIFDFHILDLFIAVV